MTSSIRSVRPGPVGRARVVCVGMWPVGSFARASVGASGLGGPDPIAIRRTCDCAHCVGNWHFIGTVCLTM